MFKIFKRNSKKDDFEKVIDEEVEKNLDILESLREYDEGKKEISTAAIRARLPNIRVSSE